MKRFVQGLVAVGVLAFATQAQAQYSIASPHRGVDVNLWNQELSGSVGGTVTGLNGSASVNPDKDSSFGVSGNLGKWELAFNSLDNNTSATVNATFRFDGNTYLAGDTLTIKHEVKMFDVFRRWTLGSSENGQAHAVFGFKVLDFDSQVTSRTIAGLSGKLDETVPVPMIGVGGTFGPRDGIHGFAGFRLIDLGVSDVEAKLFDYSLGVAYQPNEQTRIALGYRSFNMDIEITDVGDSGRIDLENEGLFFSVGMKF